MFAREVAKQGAVGDFHAVAVIDAQGAAVLVVVQGRLAILEAAVLKFGGAGFFQTNAIPAATTHVEYMKPCSVGYGEDDGVIVSANGIQRSVSPDGDAVVTIEQNRGSSHNIQMVFNDDVVGDKNGVGVPNTRLYSGNFYILCFGIKSAKQQKEHNSCFHRLAFLGLIAQK